MQVIRVLSFYLEGKDMLILWLNIHFYFETSNLRPKSKNWNNPLYRQQLKAIM